MSYVDKIRDKNQVEHEIHDARIPEAEAGDEGKVLTVGTTGAFEFLCISSFEEIDLSSDSPTTNQQVYDALKDKPKGFYRITVKEYGSGLNKTFDYYLNGIDKMGPQIFFKMFSFINGRYLDTSSSYEGIGDKRIAEAYFTNYPENPEFRKPTSSDAGSKTYVLKCINGTIQWVEEQQA